MQRTDETAHDQAQPLPESRSKRLDRRAFVGGLAVFGASLAFPQLAFADEEEPAEDELTEEERAEKERQEAAARAAIDQVIAVREQVNAMQQELAAASDAYYKALDEKKIADLAVEDAQARLDSANARIEVLQERLAQRARTMYRDKGNSAIDLVFGSTTFEELATGWDLLTRLNEFDAELVEQTKALRAEVEAEKAELDAAAQTAAEKEQEALRIKEEAEATVAQLQALLDQLDAEAMALLEEQQAEDRERLIAEAHANVGEYAYTGNGLDIPANGDVVDYALSRIGCAYEWGAEGPNTFDCSGLVTWAYRQVGIEVPHQTELQYATAAARLPVSEAEPGDVLWIGYGDGSGGHVGIALEKGGTRYVHAPTFGAYVRDTDPLSWAGFTHALRFV